MNELKSLYLQNPSINKIDMSNKFFDYYLGKLMILIIFSEN